MQGMDMLKFILGAEFITLLGVLLTLVCTAILWYYWYVHRHYAKFPSYRFETWLPFLILEKKNLNNVMIQKFFDLGKRFESDGMFIAWIGFPYMVVFGADIVKVIVNEPEIVDKPKLYELLEFGLGKGLVTSNGETWRKQRKLINPAFHVGCLKEHTSVMNENADALVKKLSTLRGQSTNEIIDMLSECSLQIALGSTTGRKYEGDIRRLIEVIQASMEFLVYRFWCPWLYFDFMLKFFPSSRKALRVIEEALNVSKQILTEEKDLLIARQRSSKSDKSHEDCEIYGRKAKSFINILLEQYLQDPSFSMKALCDQANILLIGAFDTTAHALMWGLFLLGLHQDIQERAYEEVLAETDGEVWYKDLPNLTYLECVIKETLRIYPPVPAFGRRLSKDIQCGEYLIPENTEVFILTYMVHRNPEIYPDPEKFDPERFMAKDSKINPWNLIPFAEGNRSCIGKNFAMMELKIILARILRNFKVISLDRREDVEFSWNIIMGSAKKLRMRFIPRN